ncbi:shikimate kinase [Tissierella creatinini]|nr:shikimate kinase [Tissierella creatinini]TJX69082.1 shikimate kinase [Soehngenia saccharolytica]
MKNIVLIGMSGVGKTEIGKILAEAMSKNFCDTDDLIEEKENLSISEIFEKNGEGYFRDVEHQVVNQISDKEDYIISTGGGVVLREDNIQVLRRNGYIILLMGKIDTIIENLNRSKVVRPLLKESQDLYKKVENIFMEREGLYLISSDIIIDVDNKKPSEISKEILMELDKFLSRSF